MFNSHKCVCAAALVSTLLGLGAAAANASPPGRNGQIAYTVIPSSGDWRLVISNADGSHAHPMSLAVVDPLDAAWSPDGRWLAFSAAPTPNAQSQLYVVRANGQDLRRLTWDGSYDRWPTWSPNGQRIAFTEQEPPFDPVEGNAATSHVDVIGVDGRDLRRIYTTHQTPMFTSWSPKGGRLFFSEGTDTYLYGADTDVDTSHVKSVLLDGSGLTDLGLGSAPDVSPDGSWIAYTGGPSEAGGFQQVHVMRPDGGQDHVIGHYGWYGAYVKWAPDAHSLLVEGQDAPNENCHVFRMSLGGKRVQLTHGDSLEVLPSEQPIGDRA